jgi:hypothetical protein
LRPQGALVIRELTQQRTKFVEKIIMYHNDAVLILYRLCTANLETVLSLLWIRKYNISFKSGFWRPISDPAGCGSHLDIFCNFVASLIHSEIPDLKPEPYLKIMDPVQGEQLITLIPNTA